MKPPVEAPASRHARPVGSIPNASSACSSLAPARLAQRGFSTSETDASAATSWPGFSCRLPSELDGAGVDERLGLGARARQAALGQELVESDACHAAMVVAALVPIGLLTPSDR